MKVGVQTFLDSNLRERFAKIKEMGFDNCQTTNWNMSHYTDEMAELVLSACEEFGITVTAHWAGWCPPAAWNFTEGPATLGIVPREWRERRVKELKQGFDFAKKIGAETENNRILVDEKMKTSIPGLFAAGDCIGGLLQVSVAVGEGAKAAMSAIEFVRKS